MDLYMTNHHSYLPALVDMLLVNILGAIGANAVVWVANEEAR